MSDEMIFPKTVEELMEQYKITDTEQVYTNGAAHRKEESDSLRELTTLYEAIGHKQWEDSGEPEWDVRSHKPMMCGKEPVPEIERIDE